MNHGSQTMKKILTINLKVNQEIQDALNIETIDVTHVNEEAVLGDIICGNCSYDHSSLTGSFIIMNECSEEEMNQISALLKSHGEHPIQIVVTQHNKQWKIKDLIEEVNQEHALFSKMNELGQYMRKLNDAKDLRLNNEDKETIMEAFSLFQKKEISLEKIDTAIVKMKQLLAKDHSSCDEN